VLELCSDDTGAGKSQLLYYIITQAILPNSHESTLIGGKNGAVVFFDTNARFDVHRLVQIMTSYIASKVSEDEPIDDVQALIERSLQHVHIFQPRSISAVLESLQGLKKYLFNSSAHFSSNRAVHSIIIDSPSAFYWEYRADLNNQELYKLDAKAIGASAAVMPPPKPNPYALLVNSLRSLQQALNCAVIATSTASKYKDANTGELTTKTLPAPWPSFTTARLGVKREQVRRFAVGISWEDAERDRLFRQEAVEKGHFVANPLLGGEGFRFAITKEGVRLVEEEEQRREMEQ
jgi:hypothetical protein